MKCILDRCKLYFESDNRASCEVCSICNKHTECPIEYEIERLEWELNKMKKIRDKVQEIDYIEGE